MTIGSGIVTRAGNASTPGIVPNAVRISGTGTTTPSGAGTDAGADVIEDVGTGTDAGAGAKTPVPPRSVAHPAIRIHMTQESLIESRAFIGRSFPGKDASRLGAYLTRAAIGKPERARHCQAAIRNAWKPCYQHGYYASDVIEPINAGGAMKPFSTRSSRIIAIVLLASALLVAAYSHVQVLLTPIPHVSSISAWQPPVGPPEPTPKPPLDPGNLAARSKILPLLQKDHREAFLRLANANRYESERICYEARISDFWKDLESLNKDPKAAHAYKEMLEIATPSGQLYALDALFDIDRKAYATALERLKTSKQEIRTQIGCIIMKQQASEVAKMIDAWNRSRESQKSSPPSGTKSRQR
jgi:hypothetical protein